MHSELLFKFFSGEILFILHLLKRFECNFITSLQKLIFYEDNIGSFGVFIPLKKQAETEVNWTEEEIGLLKSAVQPSAQKPGNVRDGIDYRLQYEDKSFVIDWQKIPTKYKAVLEKLKGKLTVEKT